jgi:hypothetical protein
MPKRTDEVLVSSASLEELAGSDRAVSKLKRFRQTRGYRIDLIPAGPLTC